MSTPQTAHPPKRRGGWRADDLHPEDIAGELDRFHSFYDVGHPLDCWLWRGSTDPAGYGIFNRSSKSRRPNLLAHRVAWVAWTDESLTGNLTIDHVWDKGCRNRNCVNPGHLEPVTMAENVSRARRAALGGRLQTREEVRAKQREADRLRYWADPESARAKKATRKPCPECGHPYRSSSMARHRRAIHGGAL